MRQGKFYKNKNICSNSLQLKMLQSEQWSKWSVTQIRERKTEYVSID